MQVCLCVPSLARVAYELTERLVHVHISKASHYTFIVPHLDYNSKALQTLSTVTGMLWSRLGMLRDT